MLLEAQSVRQAMSKAEQLVHRIKLKRQAEHSHEDNKLKGFLRNLVNTQLEAQGDFYKSSIKDISTDISVSFCLYNSLAIEE